MSKRWRLSGARHADDEAQASHGRLATAIGVQRRHVNEICNDRRRVTAPGLILARVFSPFSG
jgi:plasmid maintenance system antidote protein VapI